MAATSQSLRIQILKFGYAAGLTSIRWDDREGVLIMLTTRYRYRWILIQNVLVLLYQIFLVYQSTVRNLGSGFSESDLVRVQYTTGLWLFMNVNHVGEVWATDYVKLMNGLESFKVKCGVNTGEGGAAVFNKVLAFITTFNTVVTAIAVLAGSTSLTLLTSLWVADDRGTPVGLPWRAPAAAFHLVTNGFRLFSFWLKCNSVVYLAFGMFNTLERMTPSVQSNSNDRSNVNVFRQGLRFARNYRALAVLQAHYAGLYRHYIALILTGAIFAVTFNMYQAVVGDSVRALLLTLTLTFGQVQFIQATALVCDTSGDVLNRKVYVPAGSFFYIDRGLVLTVLSIITNAASSLILAK